MPYFPEGSPKGLSEAAFTEKELLYCMPSFVNLSKGSLSRIRQPGYGLWIFQAFKMPSDLPSVCLAFSTEEINQTLF